MGAERRLAERKSVDCINIADLTSLTSYTMIAKSGHIIDASTSGFLVLVNRKDLSSSELRSHLSLDMIVGQPVVMYLPQMNLDLDGTISRATHTGRGYFEVAIEFSEDVPDYWRECLIDLLPSPGEVPEEFSL